MLFSGNMRILKWRWGGGGVVTGGGGLIETRRFVLMVMDGSGVQPEAPSVTNG